MARTVREMRPCCPQKVAVCTLTCFAYNHTQHIDNEHYEVEHILINDLEGTYFNSTDAAFQNILVWNDKKRYYTLMADLDKEILLEIAKNIK